MLFAYIDFLQDFRHFVTGSRGVVPFAWRGAEMDDRTCMEDTAIGGGYYVSESACCGQWKYPDCEGIQKAESILDRKGIGPLSLYLHQWHFCGTQNSKYAPLVRVHSTSGYSSLLWLPVLIASCSLFDART